MTQTSASSCVLSIISSFSNGLDVFKRFRELGKSRKSKTKKKATTQTDDELLLMTSLRQGPEDIGLVYQKSISAIGEHFAQGDVVANTALAEVLLKLNTGIVTVINAFLARDKKDAQLDYRSLTALSDTCRFETCHTLRQLYRRLLHRSSKVATPISGPNARTNPRRRSNPRRSNGDTPVLARVVIADSSKPGQMAMVRTGERKKRKASSSGPSMKAQSSVSLGELAQTTLSPVSKDKPSAASGHSTFTKRKLSKQSLAHLSLSTPELARAQAQQPNLPSAASLPMVPRRLDKPTPTYYSLASDTTKLGEIPLHEWAEPVDFDAMSRLNKEAAANGWPFNDTKEVQLKQRKGGLFKLFRRKSADA